MAVKKLPKVPSALIRLALNDLKVMEKTKGVTIDMNSWVIHKDETDKMKEFCSVCFAGSVMMNQYPRKIKQYLKQIREDNSQDDEQFIDDNGQMTMEVSPEDFDDHTNSCLIAINEFRVGNIRNGIEYLGIDITDNQDVFVHSMEHISIGNYHNDADTFKEQMSMLANMLESIGL